MSVGQDVEDLLFELVGGHMISVLGSTDEVITQLLLLLPVRSILVTVGLEEGENIVHSHQQIFSTK